MHRQTITRQLKKDISAKTRFALKTTEGPLYNGQKNVLLPLN